MPKVPNPTYDKEYFESQEYKDSMAAAKKKAAEEAKKKAFFEAWRAEQDMKNKMRKWKIPNSERSFSDSAFRTGNLPAWAEKEGAGTQWSAMRTRMMPAQHHQKMAAQTLEGQVGDTPAAQRAAAYQLALAGNKAAAAQAAGGGPAAQRAAMAQMAQAGSGIAGKGMGAAADEATQARLAASAAQEMATKTETGMGKEALAWTGLGTQDKWNRAKNLMAYEQERFKRGQQQKALEDAIKTGDWDLLMKLISGASTAISSVASAAGSSGSSDSSEPSGYDTSSPSDRRLKKNKKKEGSYYSDKKLKKNKKDDGSLTVMIRTLVPYSYDYTDEAREKFGDRAPKGRQVGVMAQDLEKTKMGRKFVDEEGGYKMVKYGQMLPTLLAAIVNQQKRIDKLEKKGGK